MECIRLPSMLIFEMMYGVLELSLCDYSLIRHSMFADRPYTKVVNADGQ